MDFKDDDFYISDEDDEINRIGNIPLHWYDEFDHQGYTIDGERLKKIFNKSDSELQELLNSNDPDAWRTIYDQKNQTSVKLTNEDLDIIRRISSQRYANPDFDAEGFHYENDSLEDRIFPISNRPIPKRWFIPSKSEAKKITHLVKLIRLKILHPIKKEPQVFDLWENAIFDPITEGINSKGPPHIPAPRMELPAHEHSYNPPEEYLLDDDELSKLEKEGEIDNKFIPSKYDCLRKVPSYSKLISERFERCLDLYLCPRAIKMRMNVDPDSILPPPIDTNDLKPYPTSIRIRYEVNDEDLDTNIQISCSLDGIWLAVGNGNILRIFEVSTSRLVFKWDIKKIVKNSLFENNINDEIDVDKITALSFHPNLPILACGVEEYLFILVLKLPNICFVSEDNSSAQDEEPESSSSKDIFEDPLKGFNRASELLNNVQTITSGLKDIDLLSWSKIIIDKSNTNNFYKGINNIVLIKHQSTIRQLTWHNKGGYLSVISPRAISPSQRIVIHSINKCSSITAFKKLNGIVKSVQFHNSNPWLVVATQKSVRIVDLTSNNTNNNKIGNQNTNKSLIKKLIGIEDPTCITIDSTGKHIFIGQSNSKVAWYDLDLGNTPYKILRYSESSVKQVQFHLRRSMVFSATKNGNINVFHCRMPTDIISDPVFVPLKLIKGEFSMISSALWHPKQPWIFSAGVDKKGELSLVLWA